MCIASLFFREIRHKVIGNYFQVVVPQAKYSFFWINQLHEHKIYGKINLQTIFANSNLLRKEASHPHADDFDKHFTIS